MNVRSLCALGLVLGACAQGAEGTDPNPWQADGSSGTEGDAGRDGGITPPGDGSDGSGDGALSDGDPANEPDAGGGDGSAGDGSAGDGSAGDGSAGDGSSGDGGDGNPEPLCPAMRGCNGALLMSDFAGDDSGQPTVSASGSGSEWLTINIKEESNSLTGLSVRFELHGQPDADYDLFVYEGCDDGSPQASASLGYSEEKVDLSWGDTPLFIDDSKQLTVEVRHVSGACSAWTLDVVKP